MKTLGEHVFLDQDEQRLSGCPEHVTAREINFWAILERTKQDQEQVEARLAPVIVSFVSNDTPLLPRIVDQRLGAAADTELAITMAQRLLGLDCSIDLCPPPPAQLDQEVAGVVREFAAVEILAQNR